MIQPDLRKLAAYENIFDLGVIGDERERCIQKGRPDEAPECEGGQFCPIHYSPKENFDHFIELDQYSMIMTGLDILSTEAADYVAQLWEKRRIDPPKSLGWNIVGANYSMMGAEEEWRALLTRHGISRSEVDRDAEIISG
ncbi:hypothetical protein ACFCXT_06335 [Streptomyces vinaceus]|uniref:hypothetical protein n=1 Tax=Streptomyces vinaceus TaxID=1960 RepID=UPI0035DCDF2F